MAQKLVRTQEGAQHFGQPIGSVIIPDVYVPTGKKPWRTANRGDVIDLNEKGKWILLGPPDTQGNAKARKTDEDVVTTIHLGLGDTVSYGKSESGIVQKAQLDDKLTGNNAEEAKKKLKGPTLVSHGGFNLELLDEGEPALRTGTVRVTAERDLLEDFVAVYASGLLSFADISTDDSTAVDIKIEYAEGDSLVDSARAFLDIVSALRDGPSVAS